MGGYPEMTANDISASVDNRAGAQVYVGRGLSGSALKMIAVIVMIIDHVTAHILCRNPLFLQQFNVLWKPMCLYSIIRLFTRIAFPLFCFGIVEGFIHTHDRRKYGCNLLVFALLSEIPWNLVHENKLLMPDSQNVFFTLFFGYLCLCILDKYKNDMAKCTFLLMAVMLVSFAVKADYGPKGFCLIVVLYYVREHIGLQALAAGTLINPASYGFGALAFVPVAFYNGKRGFIHGKFWKYFFYVVYPGHLLLIWCYLRYTGGYGGISGHIGV
jgi:hypothetical protein